ELLARVHAVLRRTKPPIDQLRLGNTVIDFKQLKAYCGTKRVELTDREFEILRCLAERAGHVVTRDELLHLVRGYADAPLTRTVDNFIFRLRHKLEPDPRHPTYIRKAYVDGYGLIPGCSVVAGEETRPTSGQRVPGGGAIPRIFAGLILSSRSSSCSV